MFVSAAIILFGMLAAVPNVLTPEQQAKYGHFLPSNPVTLGLDLKGGSHLVLEVDSAALRKARERGLVTIGFTGTRGESMRSTCDHLFVAPTDDTPVVQQIHMTAGHAICDQVERAMMGGTTAT